MRMNEKASLPLITRKVNDRRESSPTRIMIVTSGEPFDVPRIQSLAEICRQISQTEIIGVNTKTDRPTREYDGTLFVERISIESCYLPASRTRLFVFILYRCLKRLCSKSMASIPEGKRASFPRSLSVWIVSRAITEALYQRIRATSVIPSLIICCGLNALAAGVRMKKLYGCPTIFDEQGSWFVEQEVSNAFSQTFRMLAERRLFPFVDLTISNSLPMSKEFRRYRFNRIFRNSDGALADKEYERAIRTFFEVEGEQ